MNQKTNTSFVKKYSHSMRIVCRVFYWMAIIGACGTAIAAIVISLIPSSKFILDKGGISHLNFSLDGFIRYNFKDLLPQDINMKRMYITIMVMAAFLFVLIIPVVKQLMDILKTVEEDKPFAEANANRIAIIGTVLMVSSFLIPAFEVFVARVMIDTLNIQNIGTNYSVNIILILTGFLMFILSDIFKYGSYLQHEYDETV